MAARFEWLAQHCKADRGMAFVRTAVFLHVLGVAVSLSAAGHAHTNKSTNGSAVWYMFPSGSAETEKERARHSSRTVQDRHWQTVHFDRHS